MPRQQKRNRRKKNESIDREETNEVETVEQKMKEIEKTCDEVFNEPAVENCKEKTVEENASESVDVSRRNKKVVFVDDLVKRTTEDTQNVQVKKPKTNFRRFLDKLLKVFK